MSDNDWYLEYNLSGLPSTIKNPLAFKESKPCGFDGEFDWSWTNGCFGPTISPMDIDGMIERHGNFFVFESKKSGVKIPEGQMITLKSLLRIGVFTIMIVYGKLKFESFRLWRYRYPEENGTSIEIAKKICKDWFVWASKIENDRRIRK